MRAGIDIPARHSARNRTTISGNQVLCASPEGISEDLHPSRPYSVFGRSDAASTRKAILQHHTITESSQKGTALLYICHGK